MTELRRALVSGPVTGGVHGWPFGAPVVDLPARGYRMDEFFLEGEATRYLPAPGTELTGDGRWRVEPAGTTPFKTRLVVIRPSDPARFGGTVVMAWNNVTAGYDGFGGGDSPVLLEAGGALVAVSAQRAGVHGLGEHPMGLLAWDPERYGSLSIPSDDFSFDIFTQAARAISGASADGSVDPMGGLEVRRIVAQGASQSAARLSAYLNAIHPLAQAIDGFMLTLYFGSASLLEVGEATLTLPAPGSGQAPPRLGLPTQLRDDLDVPVFVVNSECEAAANYGVRQPDTDRFRYWEAAGTCHISRQAMESVSARFQRDFGLAVPNQPGINELPTMPVVDAALHHMLAWVEGGGAPPVQPRIEFTGDPPEISRDEHGIARGGIRLPQVEAPVAHNSAIPLTPDFSSRLGGSFAPFAPEKVRALYGNTPTYLARFEEATRAAEKEGVVLPHDAEALISEARANIPAGI